MDYQLTQTGAEVQGILNQAPGVIAAANLNTMATTGTFYVTNENDDVSGLLFCYMSSGQYGDFYTQIYLNGDGQILTRGCTSLPCTEEWINYEQLSLDGKVDKRTGYGLSKNDFTDYYKGSIGALQQDVARLTEGKLGWEFVSELPGITYDTIRKVYFIQSTVDANCVDAYIVDTSVTPSAWKQIGKSIDTSVFYQKPATGIPKTDLAAPVQTSLGKADTAVQPAALAPIQSAIDTIEAVIPSGASAQNQLADKNYVDNSVSTNTANFVGTFNSLAELQAVQNPTNNDYGFVIEQDAAGNEYYDRYKFNGSQWLFEYKVESTPFTAAQWAAIQSGITSALVTKLNNLPTSTELTTQLAGKQDTISDLSTIRSGAAAGATAVQPAALQSGLATKQDTITDLAAIRSGAAAGATAAANTGDKAYNAADFSGLGRVNLQKNIVEVSGTNKNVLTQEMVNTANTVYHIQYDYDLNGQTITIPVGCVLEFDGGSVKNGTLVGNGTRIIASDDVIFDNITFSGTFVGALNALWIGATPNDQSFDNAAILRKWINDYSGIFNTIEFPESNYYFLTPTAMSGDLRNRKIDGCGSNFYVNIPDDGNGDGQTFLKITGESFTLQNVTISNVRKTIINDTEYNLTKTCCLEFNKAQLFTLHEVAIYYFDKAITLIDVWYGGFSGRASLMSNRICIFAKAGDTGEVNTIDFSNVRCRGVSVETAQAVWAQESGESADNYALRIASCGVDFHCISNNCKFNGMVIEGFDYGIRFNYIPRATSGKQRCLVNIQSCYFEANRTYDIYIGIGYVINPSGLNSYLYMIADVCVIGCLFHTLKKAYFDNSYVVMLGCSGICNVELGYTYLIGSLLYDGESASSKSLFAHRINKKSAVYNNSGVLTAIPNNLRENLASIEGNDLSFSVLNLPASISTNFNQNSREYGKILGQYTIGMNPDIRMQDIVMPLRSLYDRSKNAMKVEVNGRLVYADYYSVVRTALKAMGDSIPLYEFLRRWDAGIAYTGCVDNLFSYKVNADPSTGLITRDSDGTVVGVGRVAIAAGTYPTSVTRYVDVDTLVLVRYSYSQAKFESDLVQCGRNYREILPDVDSSASTNTMRYKVSEANRNLYVAKRINAICYNTTSARYEIYNGFEWVALTNRWQRYTYNDNGKSISERATMADFEGQTFLNKATGIVYTFEMNADKTTSKWRTSIGSVDSLEHPNGYNATSNPLDYLTEMNIGECVNYNGDILTLSTKRQQESQITVAARVDASTPSRASHANTLQGGKRYWVGYSIKQSWGGRMIFRKTSSVEVTDTDEIVILPNFNETAQGREFVAPDPIEYPYIFVESYYSVAEVLTFEIYVARWLEQDGATAGVLRHGVTADRPAASDIYVGFEYFDETLGKPIYRNGTAWVDATGVPAESSLKVLPISQTDYDALATKDTQTLYVITP